MSAVVDAGPLIALGKLGLIDLLPSLYVTVFVPPTVFDEVVVGGTEVGAIEALEVRRAVMRGDIQALAHEDVRVSDQVTASNLLPPAMTSG